MRDAAFAALMGALPGPNFGATRARSLPPPNFGRGSSNPGRGRGHGADFGFGFGDEAGAEVAADYGDEAGFGKHHHHKHHGHHHKHPHIAAHERMLAETHHRMRMLDPNGNSRVKVEGYSFPIVFNLTLGTASSPTATLQPNAMIKPTQVFMNAPAPAFVLISQLQIANVNAILGNADDAIFYSAGSFRTYTKLPLLDMSTRATFAGTYTGLVPPGYATSFVFPFTVTIQGPAVLAGNAPPSLL